MNRQVTEWIGIALKRKNNILASLIDISYSNP